MKKLLTIFLFSLFAQFSSAQMYFPPITGNNWDSISPASLGWCQDKIDTLLDYLDQHNTKAFILLKDGKIVVERYFGTFTQDSLWYWASAGKSLTAFLVGLAKQDGFVTLTDSTSHYLGSGWTVCPPQKEGMITVLDQLKMTTGLDDGVSDNYCTDDTCLQYLADAGTRWAYHTAPYTLLDGVIENGTGQTLNQYLLNRLKTPTGMTGNFYPLGYLNLFVSKARSMARYGLLVLNHGNWDGNQIMTDTSYFHAMTNTSQNLNESYGYLWWLNGKANYMVPGLQFQFPGPLFQNAPSDAIAALGKNGQFINVVPSQNLVFIRMGDSPDSNEVPFTFNDSIWGKLNMAMCNTTKIDVPNELSQKISLYPNPTINSLSIFSRIDSDFEIIDLLGKIIHAGKLIVGSNELDISKFGSGIYIIKANNVYVRLIVEK